MIRTGLDYTDTGVGMVDLVSIQKKRKNGQLTE